MCRAIAQVVVPADSAMAAGLLGRLGELALDREARLEGDLPGEHRTAVYLSGHALCGELLEVTADRHVRDVEQFGEVRDAHRTGSAQLGEDADLALLSEHRWPLPGSRATFPTEFNMI
jgi:hypothetical protein